MTDKEWHTAKAAIALKAIITNKEGEILVLQRPDNDYTRPLGLDLVGGGLNEFENPVDGLKREIKEETNLEVTDIHPIATESFTEEDGCFTVMIGFSCKATSSNVTLSDEHKSFQWLNVDEVLNSKIPDTYKSFVEILFRAV